MEKKQGVWPPFREERFGVGERYPELLRLKMRGKRYGTRGSHHEKKLPGRQSTPTGFSKTEAQGRRGSRPDDLTLALSQPAGTPSPDVGSQRSKPRALTQGLMPLAREIDTKKCRNGQLDCDALAWAPRPGNFSPIDLASATAVRGEPRRPWPGVSEAWEKGGVAMGVAGGREKTGS